MLQFFKKHWLKFLLGAGFITAAWFIYKRTISMNTSENGLKFIMTEEGHQNKAYKDKYGKWTIGVGHLIKPNEQYLLTKILTDAEVMALLRQDIKEAEDTVNASILIPIKQYQFDALVSLEFNIGRHAFETSTLHNVINGLGSKEEITKWFSAWNSHGLLKNRRAKEDKLYLTGDYSEHEFTLTASEMAQYYKAA